MSASKPQNSKPMGVRAQVWYRAGQASTQVETEQVPKILKQEQGLLWTGLYNPEPQMLYEAGQAYGLPEDAIEELLIPHKRPKLIEYGDFLLVVVITVGLKDKRPIFGETQLLIGKHFLLTIRRSSQVHHGDLRARLEKVPDLLARGPDYVASELLDFIVDHYLQSLDVLERAVENIEQQFLLHGFRETDVRRIYRLRRDLLRTHTVVTPLAEICQRLSRIESEVIDAHARAYYLEVSDRVRRTSEFIYALREAVAFAFEGGMMIEQMKQTDTGRKLASWAAILAVPTALAGIYGMNFKIMPELEWTLGYPFVLAVMGGVCGTLYWKFKKMKWL